MKINKLTMSAFGPYARKETIDFGKINEKRLFLVTGPTGAGKTSIFDAITYALFGNASGNERVADNFRSHHATMDDETYVELDFTIKGIDYHIRRSPKQERRKAKGEGVTTKNAEAELVIRGLKPYIGINEVNTKITEILGINYDQFRQIVMLPQGEFRKLLEANSVDREDIFRRIFKTQGYKIIQEKLKTKAGLLKADIVGTSNLLDNNVSRITCEDEILYEMVNSQNKNYGRIIQATKLCINNLNDKLEGMSIEIAKYEEKILKYEKLISEGIIINSKFQRQEELLTMRGILSQKKDSIYQKEHSLVKANNARVLQEIEFRVNNTKQILEQNVKVKEKNEKEANELRERLITIRRTFSDMEMKFKELPHKQDEVYLLKEELKRYEEIKKKESEINILKKNLNDLTIIFQAKTAEYSVLKDTLTALNDELLTYPDITLQIGERKLSKQQIEYDYKRLGNLRQLIKEVICLKEQHIEYGKKYNDMQNNYIYCRNEYNELLMNFKRGQAGLLASSLSDGMKCPVCGSTTHPEKARILDKCVSEEELSKYEKQLGTLEKEVSKAYELVLNKHNSINEKNTQCEAIQTELSIKINEDVNVALGDTIRMIELKTTEIKDLDEIIKNLEEKQENKKVTEQKLVDINKLLLTLETEIGELKQSKMGFEQEYVVKEKLIKDLKENLNQDFGSSQQVKTKLDQILLYIVEVTESYQALLSKIESNEKQVLILETQISSYTKNINEQNEILTNENMIFCDKLGDFAFIDYNDYKSSLLSHQQIKELEIEISTYKEEFNYVIKTLSDLSTELNGMSMVDVEGYKKEQSDLKIVCENFRVEYRKIDLQLQNNLKVIREVESLYKKVKDQIALYSVLNDLSKAANGDNEQKITFERYVLAAYFDEIIAAANIRLNEMSCNRYMLCRKEERGKGAAQQGLDLEVLDFYTSKSRPVKTLSGGESFLASLALALGLADVVQGYSGGIQLDTIFIDEGFGSLDPESLDHAISTLMGIEQTGRMVGIISHVEELKERIEVKLEIIPSKQGSTTRIIY